MKYNYLFVILTHFLFFTPLFSSGDFSEEDELEMRNMFQNQIFDFERLSYFFDELKQTNWQNPQDPFDYLVRGYVAISNIPHFKIDVPKDLCMWATPIEKSIKSLLEHPSLDDEETGIFFREMLKLLSPYEKPQFFFLDNKTEHRIQKMCSTGSLADQEFNFFLELVKESDWKNPRICFDYKINAYIAILNIIDPKFTLLSKDLSLSWDSIPSIILKMSTYELDLKTQIFFMRWFGLYESIRILQDHLASEENEDLLQKYYFKELGKEKILKSPLVLNAYEKVANIGNIPAKISLAYAYAQGKGVKKDLSKSYELYEFAVNGGDQLAKKLIPVVMNNLAFEYWDQTNKNLINQNNVNIRINQNNVNIPINQNNVNIRINQNNVNIPIIQNNVGNLINQNNVNNPIGQNNVGNLINQIFNNPIGQNNVGNLINQIFNIPIAQNNVNNVINQNNVDNLIDQNDVDGYQKSFVLYEKAAKMGLPKAMYNVANLYKKGQGVAKNSLKAFEWFQMAFKHGHRVTEQDHFDFLRDLADAYHFGKNGVSKDLLKALSFYKESIKMENVNITEEKIPSQLYYDLGVAYYQGIDNCEKDIPKAIKFYEKAGKLKNLNALKTLSNIYLNGDSSNQINKDGHKAVIFHSLVEIIDIDYPEDDFEFRNEKFHDAYAYMVFFKKSIDQVGKMKLLLPCPSKELDEVLYFLPVNILSNYSLLDRSDLQIDNFIQSCDKFIKKLEKLSWVQFRDFFIQPGFMVPSTQFFNSKIFNFDPDKNGTCYQEIVLDDQVYISYGLANVKRTQKISNILTTNPKSYFKDEYFAILESFEYLNKNNEYKIEVLMNIKNNIEEIAFKYLLLLQGDLKKAIKGEHIPHYLEIPEEKLKNNIIPALIGDWNNLKIHYLETQKNIILDNEKRYVEAYFVCLKKYIRNNQTLNDHFQIYENNIGKCIEKINEFIKILKERKNQAKNYQIPENEWKEIIEKKYIHFFIENIHEEIEGKDEMDDLWIDKKEFIKDKYLDIDPFLEYIQSVVEDDNFFSFLKKFYNTVLNEKKNYRNNMWKLFLKAHSNEQILYFLLGKEPSFYNNL